MTFFQSLNNETDSEPTDGMPLEITIALVAVSLQKELRLNASQNIKRKSQMRAFDWLKIKLRMIFRVAFDRAGGGFFKVGGPE